MSKYEVNIDLANQAKKEMGEILANDDSRLLNKVGAFSSLFHLDTNQYKDPVLVLKTEEPGSKQLLAMQYDRIEGVCHDMINHLVNDCIVMGSKPLTVQDAIICGKMDKETITRIVKALSIACKNNECILTGGETSEQPGVLSDDTYILTSSIVGVVERDEIIDGSSIEVGDCVVALASNGIHTNGYTLVRRIIKEHPELLDTCIEGEAFIDAVLKPHRTYYTALKDLFPLKVLNGLAHITGGGICENLNRILPNNVNAKIDLSLYKVPAIFGALQKAGDITAKEMLRTFNLGVGIAAVLNPGNVEHVISHCKKHDIDCYVIGQITSGNGQVVVENSLAI